MTTRAKFSIALALIAFPALLNAHLGQLLHTVAEIALLSLVVLNLWRRQEA